MWLFALPLALSRTHGSGLLPYDLTETAGNAPYLLATFSGPTVAALIVTSMTEGRAGINRLLKRCVQWRVAPQWYLVALGINMLIWLLAYTALLHAASNASAQWLGMLLSESGLQPPQERLTGFLVTTN